MKSFESKGYVTIPDLISLSYFSGSEKKGRAVTSTGGKTETKK